MSTCFCGQPLDGADVILLKPVKRFMVNSH